MKLLIVALLLIACQTSFSQGWYETPPIDLVENFPQKYVNKDVLLKHVILSFDRFNEDGFNVVATDVYGTSHFSWTNLSDKLVLFIGSDDYKMWLEKGFNNYDHSGHKYFCNIVINIYRVSSNNGDYDYMAYLYSITQVGGKEYTSKY